MRNRSGWGAGVVLVAVAVAAVVLLGGGDRSPSLDRQVAEVAGDLRCPTCDGESVGQSNAPMARSMRSEIRAQLADGRTPDQVRSWFRERYGDDVLLTPGTGGVGWLLWLGPPVALAVGAAVILARRRRPAARAVPTRSAPAATTPVRLRGRYLAVTVAVLAVVGVGVPQLFETGGGPEQAASADRATTTTATARTDPAAVAQELDDAGRYDEAVVAWRRARKAHPSSDVVRTRLAFDLLRVHRPDDVPALVRALAHRPGPQRAIALLVLGLAQRDLGRPAADRTLRAFLDLAPDHPAADQVRRLLAEHR